MIGNKFLLNIKIIVFKYYILLYIKVENCVLYIMLLYSWMFNNYLVDEELSGR